MAESELWLSLPRSVPLVSLVRRGNNRGCRRRWSQGILPGLCPAERSRVAGGGCLNTKLPPKSLFPPPAGSWEPLRGASARPLLAKGRPKAASLPAPRLGPRLPACELFECRAQAAVCAYACFCSVGNIPRKPHLERSCLSSEAAWTRPPEFVVLNSLLNAHLPSQESLLIPRMGK